MTDIDNLRAFAQDIVGYSTGSLDGCDIEDIAVKHGLLVEREMDVPCGEVCSCADCGATGKTTCYRKTPLLTGVAE